MPRPDRLIKEHPLYTLADIRIRDPFILADSTDRTYYLYGTTDTNPWHGPGSGFDAYRSTDLVRWEGPYQVFTPPASFWATTHFWAPEVYRDENRYLMFATFGAAGRRGTQVLTSASPLGPFEPWSEGPVTPAGWLCLDGTPYRDPEGALWMVFCHEWLQIGDGTICAQRLSDDLRRPVGDPVVLFSASQASWTVPLAGGGWVTDGPHVVSTADGQLTMLWSSRSVGGYSVGISRSASGSVIGPWVHDPTPLCAADGGHAMTLRSFEGRELLVMHRPNEYPHERAVIGDLELPASNDVPES